ncbi:hypothetical protein GGF46_003629 [Coemansia sp. RSA 552]|nr:hypothetical protein GGF46_003629 [Coemansia sp. RSA 552]
MLDPGPILRILEAAFPATQQIKLEASNTRISHPIMAPISTIGHIVHMEVSCCPAFVLGNAPMPSLSSLVMTMPSTDTAGMISLARKHASTLVKLNVKQISTLDCGRLVADEHGATTVYARLKVLTLDVLGAYSENELRQRTAPAGTPFPALVHLSCNSAYPFANDVLLRGALPTLRKLVIPADAAVISWLFPGPLHGAKAVNSLSKFLSLAGLEVRIITRAHPLDARNIAIQARILGAASQAPQLNARFSMASAMVYIEEPFPYVTKSAAHSRSGSSIAISASSRVSLSHRLSQSSQHIVPGRPSTSRTMPISVRPRFNSAMSSFRPGTAHQRQASGVEEFGGAELTIRLSVDASQSRNYRMLVAGDTVLADLRMLEDENQRVVSPAQAGLGTKLIALYFGASWSADCDAFAPQLQGLAAAHHDDLAVVHVSMDNHPADMARTMAGSGWLGVPWSEHGLRQALAKRLEVAATELPRLVIVDGHSHHIISPSARTDVERRPLSCVREWKKSRAGLTWWNRVKPWASGVLVSLLVWNVVLFAVGPALFRQPFS